MEIQRRSISPSSDQSTVALSIFDVHRAVHRNIISIVRPNGRLTGLVTSYVETAFYNKLFIEGKIKGQIDVTRRRGRRRKKLLDDLKNRIGYCQLKEEVLDRTVWMNRFGRGFGPVV